MMLRTPVCSYPIIVTHLSLIFSVCCYSIVSISMVHTYVKTGQWIPLARDAWLQIWINVGIPGNVNCISVYYHKINRKQNSKKCIINPFLFIRRLSCPHSVETSLTQNFLKLTKTGFPYNLLLVSCDGIGFSINSIGQALAWISGLKVLLVPLGPSCLVQTILLSDLVRFGSCNCR